MGAVETLGNAEPHSGRVGDLRRGKNGGGVRQKAANVKTLWEVEEGSRRKESI